MMRAHCDRCDKLVDECPTWVEDKDAPFDAVYDHALPKPIWHIFIHAGGDVRTLFDAVFCRACRITILEAMLASMRGMKGPGGHLADCQWSDTSKRWYCTDGCEIKALNETITKLMP